MTTTAEILQKARDLISDEKNWTQEEFARDEQGMWTGPLDDNAKCFCAIGAVARVSRIDPDDYFPGEKLMQQAAFEMCGTYSIASFNDSRTHAEVLDLFDRAIKRAISAEEAAHAQS